MYAFPVLSVMTEVLMVLFRYSTQMLRNRDRAVFPFSSISVLRACETFSFGKMFFVDSAF
jgi:hypothetical protein